MRKKRNILLSAAVIIAAAAIGVSAYMFLRGNGKQKQASKDSDTFPGVTSYNYLGDGYSDKGIVWTGDDGLMHFMDAISKETTVICDKANCEHEPYDENTNPDPICNGYMLGLSATVSNILMVEDSLYFWGMLENDTGEMQDVGIYRADLNGDHKKKVATVPNSTEYVFQSAASDGRYLVVGYSVNYEQKESGELVELDRPEGGIIILDLRDYSVIDDRIENMRLPNEISFANERIYIEGLFLQPDYSQSELASLSDEELTEYFEQHEYTGLYIYNLELHRGAQQEMLDDTGEQRQDMSDLLLNGDMVVFTKDADIVLYHEQTHSYETIYSDWDGYWSEKMYEPVCWKGSEIYLSKYDGDETGIANWVIYDTKDGSKREMGTTKNKNINYGLGDYLFGMDWDTGAGSAFVLTEEEFFGTGTGSGAAVESESQTTPDTVSESSHKVVWASMVGDGISVETQEKINQILQEEGCSYQVEFRTASYEVSSGEDVAESIRKQCPSADIMQVADVGDADTINLSMVRGGYFEPLQSWLDSDAGRPLRNALPAEKWETVSVDGAIYTVPNTGLTDEGIYFVMNPKYVTQNMLQDFDGTIQGVEKIISSLGKEQIGSPVLLGISGVSLANSAGGRYFGGLFWQEDGSISAWYQAKPIRALYESLHRLYQQGALSENMTLSAEASSECFLEKDKAVQNQDFAVYIGSGNEKMSEYDWTDYTVVYGDKLIVSNINCSTGISAVSDNKEEAEDFLLRAYTDQRIANLMVYDEQLPGKLEEDGKILYSEERYGEMVVNGLAYGNTMVATPMRQEDTDSRAAAWSERMKKCGKKSAYLGVLPDLTGWEDTANTLVTLLEENVDVWKEEDFDQSYADLVKKSQSARIEEYVKEMEKQQKEQAGK